MALNYRLMKLSYTNFSDRLNLHSLRLEEPQVASPTNPSIQSQVPLSSWNLRRVNMLLSVLMVPSDIALCFVAISAF